MLTFDISVSGGQVGRQLATDPEELRYALEAIMEEVPAAELGEDLIRQFYSFGQAQEIADYLRTLADRITAELDK
jgi:hypothetical protein